uniref:Uncharacterized protein n=1 Tax=Triticum urartu TaxID=4572 RepID=A0A8R7P9Y5_TRIUA
MDKPLPREHCLVRRVTTTRPMTSRIADQ